VKKSLLIVLILLLGSTITFAQQGIADLTVTITQNVNIRSAPSADAERLGTVERGTAFRLDGRNESGEWVRGITQRGTVGWIINGPTGLSLSEIIGIRIITVDTPFVLAPPQGAAPAQPAPEAEEPPEAEPGVEQTNPAPVASTAPVRGFSYGAHIAGFEDGAMNLMAASGMTWVKKQVRWSDGQSADGWADTINTAHAYGFRILLGVVGYKEDIYKDGYFDRYADFVAQLANLGADAIEVWNEPNIDHEWPAGRINAGDYTELLRRSYTAIKRANPNVLVISGAPAPTGAEAAFPGRVVNDNNYLAGMARAGAGNYMDCVGVHYNEGILPPTARSGDPRGNSGYYTRYLPAMIDVYSGAFGGRIPLCFTELGYLTPEGYPPLSPGFAWAQGTTLAQQAAWVDGAMNYAARRGVRLVIIWNMNFRNYGADPMAGYALIRPDGTCPACNALAN